MSRLRRAVPWVLLGAGVAANAGIWLADGMSRQGKVLASLGASLLAGLLLLAWFLLGAGLSGRTRRLILAATLLSLLASAALFRIRGVTGDFVPILEPRWRPRERVAAPPSQPSGLEAPAVAKLVPKDSVAPSAAPVVRLPPRPRRDYPQFLGPRRDATVPDVELARDWTARPPRLVWRQPIGLGWSAFAVAGDVAVTQEQRGAEELVTAYELLTGRLLWSYSDAVRYESVMAGDGPRAVPAIEDGRVFAIGSTGLLNALELATGRKLWSHDVVAESSGRVPDFGKASSPLVVGDVVIVSGGGTAGRSLLAYRKHDGALAWSAGDDAPAYSSPALVTLLGHPQVVAFNAGSIVAHDPATGQVVWQHAWPRGQPNVAQPLPIGDDLLLVSAGYGVGAKALRISRTGEAWEARMAWESTRLKAKFANMFFVGGFVYGLDDGVLACLDPATGERKWRAGRYGHGQMILVGSTLLVSTEEGGLVLVDLGPDGLHERATFPALEAKTWNPPAFAAPYLLLRNDKEAALYELALEK